MKDPCKSCLELDFCQGEFPCKKRKAYLRWKEGAARIRKKFRGGKVDDTNRPQRF